MCTSCTTEKFAAYSGTPAVPLPCPFRKQSVCSQSTRRRSACSFLNPTLAHPVDCLTLANMRLTPRNESVRCGTVCSIIEYSVRIGPPQPRILLFQQLPNSLQPSEFVV